MRKEGAGFDLPMAIGILGAMGVVSADQHLFVRELSLALWRSFIPRDTQIPVPLAATDTFVQIVSNAGLQPGSRKVVQYKNLEGDTRSIQLA